MSVTILALTLLKWHEWMREIEAQAGGCKDRPTVHDSAEKSSNDIVWNAFNAHPSVEEEKE